MLNSSQNKSTLQSLLLVNIFMILWALSQQWDVTLIMWTYWCQSVIIGIFQFFKIMRLKQFSTKDLTMNGNPVQANTQGKRSVAFFFLFHFGFFHFCYFLFLASGYFSEELIAIIPIVILFFLNHLYSFFVNQKKDANKLKNIGTMMFFPYARIIPMHLTIIFGGMMIGGPFTLILFLSLKTAADAIMHLTEHKQIEKEIAHS